MGKRAGKKESVRDMARSVVAEAERRRRAAAEERQRAARAERQRRQRSAELASNPYCDPQQRVLLVGEGNFSFAAAVARALPSCTGLVATAFDSREVASLKYPDLQMHLDVLEGQGGLALFGVDATRLHHHRGWTAAGAEEGDGDDYGAAKEETEHDKDEGEEEEEEEMLFVGGPFDRVVFNFPHTGSGEKDTAANVKEQQQLLAGFFASARAVLGERGEVHVTVKRGEPYDSHWRVVPVAREQGLVLRTAWDFFPHVFPGYEHRRTLGFEAGLSAEENAEIVRAGARTYALWTPEAARLRKAFRTKPLADTDAADGDV